MLWPQRPDNWRLGAKPVQRAFVQVAARDTGFETSTSLDVEISAAESHAAHAEMEMVGMRGVVVRPQRRTEVATRPLLRLM